MKEQIQQKLEQIAFNRSIPFCYGCYKEAPTGCASLVVVMISCACCLKWAVSTELAGSSSIFSKLNSKP